MNLNEFKIVVQQAGIPAAYHHFATHQDLPFIEWQEVYGSPFYADNKTYYCTRMIEIKLHTAVKDPATEQTLENALSALTWSKSNSEWQQSDSCYITTYNVEV